MKNSEQHLKDLEERYSILIKAAHEMNGLIHELRKENQELKEIIEELQNG